MANNKQQNESLSDFLYFKNFLSLGGKTRDFLASEIKTISIALAFCVFFLFDLIFIPPPSFRFPSNKIIDIRGGETLREVKSALKENGVIKSSFAFDLTVRFLNGEKAVKAGKYLFDKPYSIFEIAKKIVYGDYGVEYKKILITEGDTIHDIAEKLEKAGVFKKSDIFEYAGCCGGKVLPSKKIEENGAFSGTPVIFEGYFFPDTYFFARNISSEEALKMIFNNFDRKTAEAEREVEASGKNFYDVLTLASILEKEVKFKEDKKMVADVLLRRIAKNMPLQVDASLDYILNKNTFELTKDDLKTDSPYNTYKYRGLPITPIANPGIVSILAAARPTPNDYWYYLSDKDGNLHYAKTYEEHKENINKYLK